MSGDPVVRALARVHAAAVAVRALDAEARLVLQTPARFAARGSWVCDGCRHPTHLGPRVFPPTVAELVHRPGCVFDALLDALADAA